MCECASGIVAVGVPQKVFAPTKRRPKTDTDSSHEVGTLCTHTHTRRQGASTARLASIAGGVRVRLRANNFTCGLCIRTRSAAEAHSPSPRPSVGASAARAAVYLHPIYLLCQASYTYVMCSGSSSRSGVRTSTPPTTTPVVIVTHQSARSCIFENLWSSFAVCACVCEDATAGLRFGAMPTTRTTTTTTTTTMC